MAQETIPLLSVVIIARNEANHIASAIESVLHEACHYPGTEIVVVDSASTDATVEIASSYPVGVIRLPATSFLSAAAGRYTGYLATAGQFILHLDGDMILLPGWLDQALPYMLGNQRVGACCGYWENITRCDGKIVHRELMEFVSDASIRNIKELAGAALYRRSALARVGGFHPYVYSYEEPELGARLRHAGFVLVCLPHQIVEHYGLPEHSVAGYWRRWKSGLWVGCGQILRLHLGKSTFGYVARLQGASYLISTLAGLLGVICLLVLGVFLKSTLPVLLAMGSIVVSLIFLLYKKRNVPRALLSLLQRALILESGVRGFFMPPRNPATYPTEVEIMRPIHRVTGSQGTEGV